MKKFIVLLCTFCAAFSFAQINIGASKSPINLYVSNHNDEIFQKVKASKTIAVAPNDIDFVKYKAIVEENWTVSDVEIITLEAYKERAKEFQTEGHTILKMIGKNYTKSKSKNGGMTYNVKGEYIIHRLTLYHFKDIKKKKGKLKFKSPSIAEAFFTPNIKLREKVIYSSGRMGIGLGSSKKSEKNKEKAGFYNYNLGSLKNMIQFFNKKLSNDENYNLNDSFANKPELKKLESSVLYAPDWVLNKYNAMSGKLSKVLSANEYFEDYKFEYKVLTADELNDKIQNATEDFYYFQPSQINQYKVINIINGRTGEIIYNESSKMSYNVKGSDFKKINKNISK